MLSWITIGIGSALIGVVFCIAIPSNDTPLNFWYVWLNKLEKFGDDTDDKSPWYRRFFGWCASMVVKPLGQCVYCFSGQLGLWTAVYFIGLSIETLYASALAIFTGYIMGVAWEKQSG